MATSLHTHVVWYMVTIPAANPSHIEKRKKKKNYFVSHSFPIRLMTTLLCCTALWMESLSRQSHSCKQSIRWGKDEIMCKQASPKQALSHHFHLEAEHQLHRSCVSEEDYLYSQGFVLHLKADSPWRQAVPGHPWAAGTSGHTDHSDRGWSLGSQCDLKGHKNPKVSNKYIPWSRWTSEYTELPFFPWH